MGKYNWNEIHLRETVDKSNCWYDWLRNLGIPTRGCNYRTLQKKAKFYNIDVSHFNYNYARTHNGMRIIRNRKNEEIFCNNIPIKNESVKNAYIERILNNIPHCECCGIKEWNNKEIMFQLHHKDGNPKNNVLENIILLCPNCHSQTDNYSNKKRIDCPIV